MSNEKKISDFVLSAMNNFLDNENCVGQMARDEDVKQLTNGSWLKNAAVIDDISGRNGAWDVSMVFANYKNPLQLMMKKITRCYSQQRAMVAAFYIRKEAAKDIRGTLTVSVNDLNLCYN
jgi:hypothetical protein